jgi:KDO2-lipid IV(A) lauroyltransferase
VSSPPESEATSRNRRFLAEPGDPASSAAIAATSARAPRWNDYLEYAVFRLAFLLFGSLPRRLALAFGAQLGELFYRFDRPHRRIALANLRRAFPEHSDEELRNVLRRSCRNLGRVAAECCHLPSLSAESVHRYVTVDDPARWQEVFATAAERGAVVLTAHFGNFELLAYAHGLLAHPITLVHRPMRNALVDRAIIALRGRAGTVSLPKKAAAKAALRALHDRRIVAIPADQNQTRRYGVFADFFGLPASTTPGPSRLAMLSRAALVPVFLVRQGESDQHRIVVLPEIELVRTGAREADVVENTRRCNAVIEEIVRRHPDQWIWFHKRWKTRPLGDPKIYP